ncbi:MAG: site-specific DNA-methyltransferase [Chloroflexi bacterium CG07_land_8_20_14_0_80_51_10]|nr:MAG: site-specific DNA-methyltransferase [Chloroflexi bacterium CG07_land_8_20_14_0_80_51_10]
MAKIEVASDYGREARAVLFEGDCREILAQIPDGEMQLVVTSPPYNLGKPYERRVDLDKYLVQQAEVIRECVRTLKPSGSICWQVGNYVDKGEIVPLDTALYPIFKGLNLHLRNRIIWYFEHGLHCSRRFSGRYETILWFTKSDEYVFNLDEVRVPQKYAQKKYSKGPKLGQYSSNPLGKNPGDIWIIPNVKHNHIEKTIHPCQFPVELIERLVLALTNEGDWALDPFIGVATTAVAAILHDRRAAGTEIVHDYLGIGRNRVRLASEGRLRIRPMGRPIYDPNLSSGEQNLSAKVDAVTLRLFDSRALSYQPSSGEGDEKSL